jgi:hypothetical protein
VADAHRNAAGNGVRPATVRRVGNGRLAQQRRVHQLLAAQPLPALKDVHETVFQKLLGEPLSGEGSAAELNLR